MVGKQEPIWAMFSHPTDKKNMTRSASSFLMGQINCMCCCFFCLFTEIGNTFRWMWRILPAFTLYSHICFTYVAARQIFVNQCVHSMQRQKRGETGTSSYTGDRAIFLNFRKSNAIKCKVTLAEINIHLLQRSFYNECLPTTILVFMSAHAEYQCATVKADKRYII